jgi:collagen type VII alpha
MPFIQLQFRRGTAAEWSADNPVLAEAEMAIETDTNLFKIGDGVLAWNALPYGGLEGSTGPTGYTGATGATGDPGLGTMMVWNAGNSANAGELSGWGGSISFNETSLSGSAIGFFSSLSSLYPWQTTYLNVTDSTGQYVTIGVSGVSYSSPVYTVTGGVVVQNGTGTFSGTCHVSYYVNTASTGATGATGPGFESISNPTSTYVLTALTSNSAQGESNLTFDGSTLSTLNVEVNGQFAIGTQRFYAQGSDGFSVNENFNAGGATQTAYHYTSGDASRDIVFDLAVSGQYTTMFGTYGNAGANDFIIGSETGNTNFTFKSGLGIAPVNLAGGTTLFGVSNNGTVFAPLLSNTVYNSTVLTFDSNTGVITYSDMPSIVDLIGDSLTLSTLTVANTISTANIYTNFISTNRLIADSISTYSMTVFGPSTLTVDSPAYFNQTTQMSSLAITGDLRMSSINGVIPQATFYTVSTNSVYTDDITIGGGQFSATGPTGPTGPGPNMFFTGNLVPTADNTYSIGATGAAIKEVIIGAGTVFIGPNGSIGNDPNGIIYTSQGFASPTIVLGATIPGATGPVGGGVRMTLTGTTGPIQYQQLNSVGGPTGAVYNLVNNVDLMSTTTGIINSSHTGPTGPTGAAGANGISGGLTLFLDAATSGTPGVSGTLLNIPNVGAQTTIASGNQTNTTVLMATYTTPTNSLLTTTVLGGEWDLNLYAAAGGAGVSYYYDVYYVTANGVTETLLVAGSSANATLLDAQNDITTYSLYVPTTTLPDLTYRIRIKVYGVFVGNNKTMTIYMRDGTQSHVHTTLVTNSGTGPTGPQGPTGPVAADANAWTAYTPSWTTDGTQPVLNNGTLVGRYKQIGKTAFVNVKLIVGSTTNTGTGRWQFTLPVNAYDANAAILPAVFLDDGIGWYQGTAYTTYAGSTSYIVPVWDKGPTGSAAIGPTTPFTWGIADTLQFGGSYESA